MYPVEQYYHKINKVFLKALGIWHHDRSRFVLLQRTLIIIMLVTHIIMQMMVFITKECDVDLFLKTISMIIVITIFILIYCVFIFKTTAISHLHQRIQESWNMIQNKSEGEILWKTIRQCHTYSVLIILLCIWVYMSVSVLQFLPIILDVIMPLDEPRPLELIITAEYFVRHDKYFYTKVLHELIIFCLFLLVGLGTLIQLLIYFHHCFGMFKLARYRVAHSIENSQLRVPVHEQNRIFCGKIMHAVIAHRRAMEFSDGLISPFNITFCIIIIIGVFSLSINLYRFVYATTVSNNMEDIMFSLVLALCHMIYMYVANYLGQLITDYNHDIFKSIYETSWYLMPVSSQKLILFLMQKTAKNFNCTMGIIFIAKIESFAMLTNTALSYVTVMLSTQR